MGMFRRWGMLWMLGRRVEEVFFLGMYGVCGVLFIEDMLEAEWEWE